MSKLFAVLMVAFLCHSATYGLDDGKGREIAPVWEWIAKDSEDRLFDGTRSLEFPEVDDLYDPAEPFSVEVRLRTNGPLTRLAGVVSHYRSSKEGAWYLSGGSDKRLLHPRVVVIDEAGYHSIEAKQALEPGEWQTLLFISDGLQAGLWLEGAFVGGVALGQGRSAPGKAHFSIGRRVKSYFTGEIERVRLWNQAIPAPAPVSDAAVSSNRLINSSFESGESLEDVLLWHRMARTSATTDVSKGWEIDTGTAYQGERSLRGGSGAPLVLMDEVWTKADRNKPWVFSAWMKADREGAEVELEVGAWWRLEEVGATSKVALTTEWKRYQIVVRDLKTEGTASETSRAAQL